MTRQPHRLPLIAAFIASLATPGIAQDMGAIADVIDDQLDAFNARDIPEAWEKASPGIQRLFGTPGNFALMVENGYPMVWNNDGATFLDLRTEADGRLWQRVRVLSADGAVYLLDYAMIETPEGWKIDAVVLLPSPEVGV